MSWRYFNHALPWLNYTGRTGSYQRANPWKPSHPCIERSTSEAVGWRGSGVVNNGRSGEGMVSGGRLVPVLQDARDISLSKGIEEHDDGVMSLKMPLDKKIGGEKDGGIPSSICSVYFPRNLFHS